MGNQRQLNGGKQGSGSGLDADQVDGKESTEVGKSISEIESIARKQAIVF